MLCECLCDISRIMIWLFHISQQMCIRSLDSYWIFDRHSIIILLQLLLDLQIYKIYISLKNRQVFIRASWDRKEYHMYPRWVFSFSRIFYIGVSLLLGDISDKRRHCRTSLTATPAEELHILSPPRLFSLPFSFPPCNRDRLPSRVVTPNPLLSPLLPIRGVDMCELNGSRRPLMVSKCVRCVPRATCVPDARSDRWMDTELVSVVRLSATPLNHAQRNCCGGGCVTWRACSTEPTVTKSGIHRFWCTPRLLREKGGEEERDTIQIPVAISRRSHFHVNTCDLRVFIV